MSFAYGLLTISAAAAALVYSALVESLSLSSPTVINVAKYELAFIYNPLEATTFLAIALGATLHPSSSEYTSESLCKGNITYYTASLRACRITSDNNVQNVVVLPYSLISPESNNNLYCSKTIIITYIATSKTTTATIVNKYIRCNSFLINLSNTAFLNLDDLVVSYTSST